MDYHLKPIGKTCAATGNELIPGSICHSVLIERDGQLVRLDYSEAGWAGPPAGAVGLWKCTVPEAEQPKAKPLDTEGLMRYFEQMVEDANPAQDRFRYVVALLLLQKKRLKLEGSHFDGEAEYLEFIGSHGEGPYEIRDPRLADGEVQQLQHELNTHLASEWN